MAPTESIPLSSQNQPPSSESKSSKGNNKPEEAQLETDPSTVKHLQDTVGRSDDLTDPSTDKYLRGAT
jgi:hypothetical protein